jgi:hypothetical protein
MDFAHRDDLDPEVLHALQQAAGDRKIACLGDIPPEEIPAGVLDAWQKFEEERQQKFLVGQCCDCDTVMPNYPVAVEKEDSWILTFPEGWQPADGWAWITGENDEIAFWQCPACDSAEEAYKSVVCRCPECRETFPEPKKEDGQPLDPSSLVLCPHCKCFRQSQEYARSAVVLRQISRDED